MNYEDRITKSYLEDVIAGAGVRIATGSYVGDGTYGREHRMSLSFAFAPKLIICADSGFNLNYNSGGGGYSFYRLLMPHMLHTESEEWWMPGGFGGESGSELPQALMSDDRKTVYWFSHTSAQGQANVNGRKYYYLAIG